MTKVPRKPAGRMASALDAPLRTKLRRLSEEEIELWLGVTASVTRRAGATLPARLAEPAAVVETPAPSVPPPARPTATPARPPAFAPLERKLKQRLARGRMSADAAIDLHGFRQAEAYRALRHFLIAAQRDGARVVLVVTGKGGRGSDPYDIAGGGVGVLRRSVPLWLAQPELRPLVIGFEEAARPQGGAGALYVRLRRL